MCWINFDAIKLFSSWSSESGCFLTQRRRWDRQCYGSRCIRLPSPCRSCADPRVELKDKILVYAVLFPNNFSGLTIWCAARHHATSGILFILRGTKLCSLMFSWDARWCTMSNHTCEECNRSEGMSDRGTLQSHFKTCHYFVVCPSVKPKQSIS